MATDLESKQGVPSYEAFVDKQLAKVRTRIRAIDAGRSVMMLGIVTLAYFLLSAVFDLAVKGSEDFTALRLVAFALYAVVMAVLAGQLVLKLYRRVNPFYAAKRLEDTIPGVKNSIINWLDLKDDQLPGAIRGALGQRAARELKQTDPDKVVSSQGNWFVGSVLAGLAVGLLILFALGPNQFGSLWQRAFTPFLSRNIDTRARITLVRPEAGNATVLLNQRVDFQVQIDGRFPKVGQPGAPRVLYRYQPADTYVALPLEEDLDGKWNATVLGDQVQNGFWYKLAAGDAETPEYQVKVQSLPQATRFEATYRYRPYRKLPDDKVVFPNEHAVLPILREYRGTGIALVVRTNRALRAAHVEVETGRVKIELAGTILPGDPKAFEVQMTLEERGTFRVHFTSNKGEDNIDRSSYQVEVLDDLAPRVVLTNPGKDVSLAVGATLPLEGSAQDDIGIKAMALRVQMLGGSPALEPRPYRQGTSFQFDNGTYPDFLEYKDFVMLDKATTANGETLPLKAGMVLEYWLEAIDNSDYPSKDGNVGKSQTYKITILDNRPDTKKQQQDRQEAEQQQKQHEQKQDQKNTKENQKRNNQGNGAPQKGGNKNDDFEKRREQAEKAINDQEQQKKGEAKGPDSKSGHNKQGDGNDNGNAEQKGANSPDKAGTNKDAGKVSQRDKSSEAKSDGAQGAGEQKASESKGPGAGEQKPSVAKGGDSKADPRDNGDQGSAKEQPKLDQAKSDGQGGAQGDSTAASKAKSKDQAAQAQAKGDRTGPPDAGAAKDGPAPQPELKGQAKGNQDAKKTDTKPGGQDPRLGNKDGAGKDSSSQAAKARDAKAPDSKTNPNSAKGKNDQPAKTNPRDADSKDIAKLKDMLNKPEQAKKAAQELERIAKEATDPAAKELLDDLGTQAKSGADAQSKNQATAKPPAQGATKEASTDGAKSAGPKTGEGTAGNAQNAQAPKNTKPGDKVGTFGEGGKGVTEEITPRPPNSDFSRRGGEMQLEELKKRMTPAILKKLNWSAADWQKFLRDAKDYQATTNRPRTADSKVNQKGQASQLPGSGVRVLDGKRSEQVDPLQAERALPPPEFRDAQRQFTTNPPGKQE